MKKTLSLALIALSLSCSRSGGGGGGSAPAPKGPPTGDPTSTYGDITAADAKSFLATDLKVSEKVSVLGLSQESAASIKASVGTAPNDGVPA